MIGASLYIIVCTARNRLRVRLRRLREPRYLVAAIAGTAYLYVTFFARLRSTSRGLPRRGLSAPRASEQLSLLVATGPALAGMGLLAATLVAWIVPFKSDLFDFSEAETQFLFPAPVSRRSLFLHRLLRSQIGAVFGAVIVGIVTPSLAGYTRLRVSVGMWLVMCTLKVYFSGVSLARTRLGRHDARARLVAWLPLGLLGACVAIVGAALMQTFMAGPVRGLNDVLSRLGRVATTGAPRVVMTPFMAVASPLFAAGPLQFFLAILAGVSVLALCVVWVLAADSAFEQATELAAERKARQQTRAVAGYRANVDGWHLAPSGRAETALAWKAAMQTLRSVDRRMVVRVVVLLASATAIMATRRISGGFAAVSGGFAVIVSFLMVFLAPQAIRLDMRQDLQHLELLKTWPLRSSVVVRGELVWPAALITTIAWSVMAIAIALSGATFADVELVARLTIGGAAIVLAPALVAAQLTIHNAAALLFPGWVTLGNQRARGLDAMGQRIITLGGAWLALAVMILPGALAGGIIWLAFRRLLGTGVFIPAACVCAVIILLEVLVTTEALGPAYERLDVMAVERGE